MCEIKFDHTLYEIFTNELYSELRELEFLPLNFEKITQEGI